MSTHERLMAVRSQAMGVPRELTFAEVRARMHAAERRERERADLRQEVPEAVPPLPYLTNPRAVTAAERDEENGDDARTPTVFFTGVDADPVMPMRWRAVMWGSALCPVMAVLWSGVAVFAGRVGVLPRWHGAVTTVAAVGRVVREASAWGSVGLCAGGALLVLLMHVAWRGRAMRWPACVVLAATVLVGIFRGMGV